MGAVSSIQIYFGFLEFLLLCKTPKQSHNLSFFSKLVIKVVDGICFIIVTPQ